MIHKFQTEFWTHSIWAGPPIHSEVSNSPYNVMDHGLLHGLVNLVVHIIVAADSCPILFSIASGDHLSDEKKYSHLYHHYFLTILTSVFPLGILISWVSQQSMTPRFIVDRRWLVAITVFLTPTLLYQTQITTGKCVYQICRYKLDLLLPYALDWTIVSVQCLAVASAHGDTCSFHRHQWFFVLACLCALRKAKGTSLP